MPVTRRSLIAAGAGLAALGSARAAAQPARLADDVANLVRLSEESNAALMRGDVDGYRALIELTEDFTLMAPFGGPPTSGAASISEQQWQAMKHFFRNGSLEVDLVQSYASADLVVLALIERSNVEVGGLAAQPWALRVTLVYRREGTGWQLAHRHGDPLASAISLEQAAALARGGPA